MATKIIFIAACVLAVTANVVRVVQDQDADYEHGKTDYEPKKTDYEPKKIDYQPRRVICVGVDVTNDCIYRADGNYAIDSEPRSGYVVCVNKIPICMPCPYGLAFCTKAGYRGLGQCLRKYEECPPRPY